MQKLNNHLDLISEVPYNLLEIRFKLVCSFEEANNFSLWSSGDLLKRVSYLPGVNSILPMRCYYDLNLPNLDVFSLDSPYSKVSRIAVNGLLTSNGVPCYWLIKDCAIWGIFMITVGVLYPC